MGRQQRRERLRQRRRAAAPDGDASRAVSSARGRLRFAFLGALEPFGGLPVVVAGVATIVVLGFLLWQSRPDSPSTAALMGDEVAFTSSTHVDSAALMDIPDGAPPAAGPHFEVPQRPGVYSDPIADGNAVHALEHGLIWFSYQPELLSEADLAAVRQVAEDHPNDVILAPRPENSEALFAVSWARRLQVSTPVDVDLLQRFVETNLNRSPEPGVR